MAVYIHYAYRNTFFEASDSLGNITETVKVIMEEMTNSYTWSHLTKETGLKGQGDIWYDFIENWKVEVRESGPALKT